FYYDKTLSRLKSYLGNSSEEAVVINGKFCQTAFYYLERIRWELLTNGVSSNFHGDLQFENVILSEDGSFYLIDWRDSFGDLHSCGDLYYDLAKLYSCLSMSYHAIKKDQFSITCGKEINYFFENLEEMKVYYEKWLIDKGFDLYKVRIISALIYL